VVFDQTDLRTELSPDMHLFVIAQRRATNLSVSSLTSEFAETQELRLVCWWVWAASSLTSEFAGTQEFLIYTQSTTCSAPVPQPVSWKRRACLQAVLVYNIVDQLRLGCCVMRA
jgi:hypothetical protein